MALSVLVTLVSLLVSLVYRPSRLPQHDGSTDGDAVSSYRIVIWIGIAVLLLWSLGPIYWTIASS